MIVVKKYKEDSVQAGASESPYSLLNFEYEYGVPGYRYRYRVNPEQRGKSGVERYTL